MGLVSQVWHVRRARPHSSGPPGLTGVAAGGGSCALGIPSLAGSTSWGSLLMGLNGCPFCATCLLKAAVCPESEADCVGTWVRLCSRVGEVCAISSGDPESRRGVPRPGGPSGEKAFTVSQPCPCPCVPLLPAHCHAALTQKAAWGGDSGTRGLEGAGKAGGLWWRLRWAHTSSHELGRPQFSHQQRGHSCGSPPGSGRDGRSGLAQGLFRVAPASCCGRSPPIPQPLGPAPPDSGGLYCPRPLVSPQALAPYGRGRPGDPPLPCPARSDGLARACASFGSWVRWLKARC